MFHFLCLNHVRIVITFDESDKSACERSRERTCFLFWKFIHGEHPETFHFRMQCQGTSRNPSGVFVITVGQEQFWGRKVLKRDLSLATFYQLKNSHLANVVAFAWFRCDYCSLLQKAAVINLPVDKMVKPTQL